MDFVDIIKQFSARAEKTNAQIQTEEATKTSLIMPFFQQVFGYDVFNPDEFVPEFTADVGIKKGEKVDYAVFFDGKPMILVEAKWCGAQLDKHDSQLFRYFGTTEAKFGILTNGLVYKFYTDLEEQNKMDLKPFLEFDLLNIKDAVIPELKRFCKSNFDAEQIFSSASELKYSNEIRNYFKAQLSEPADDFIKFILSHVYDGVKTQNIVDRFKPLIKSTLNNYISDLMNDKITSALKNEKIASEEAASAPAEQDIEESQPKIHTTTDELESFGIIKGLVCETIDPKRITFRDTASYFSILCDGKVTKWICRVMLDGKKKTLIFPPLGEAPYDKESRHQILSTNDIYGLKSLLVMSAERFIESR